MRKNGNTAKQADDTGHLIVPFTIESTETKAFKDIALPNHIDRKALDIEDDLEVFEFKGYASTFGNVDRGADVVMQGAFSAFLSNFKASSDNLPVLWQHMHSEPVGIYVDMVEDEKGLFVHGVMPTSDKFVLERVIPQMKVGSVRKMSIGYWIEDMGWDGEIRQLIKLGLWEVSLVTFAMNNSADVTEMKKADGSGYCLNDFKDMTKRDLEKLLVSGICFSNAAAKALPGILKAQWDAEDSEQRDAVDTLTAFVGSQDETTQSINNSLKRLEKDNG